MTIIYDFDGVMFDSYESVRKLMYPDLANMMGKTLTERELNYCYEHGMTDNVNEIFGDIAWACIKSLPYKEYYRKVNIMPNLRITLEKLYNMGVEIKICTNRVSGVAYILDIYGLTKYIDNVVTSKEYPSKPNPDGILSLIEGESYFVGDSKTDHDTAINAGIPFIAYQNDSIPADYHISNHLQILSLTPIKEYGIRFAGGINGTN